MASEFDVETLLAGGVDSKKNPKSLRELRLIINFAGIYVTETYLTFRGKFLSPFLSDIFMDRIVNDLHSKGLFPKIWISYVDGIFTIAHKDKMDEMLEVLNKIPLNSRSTMEIEDDLTFIGTTLSSASLNHRPFAYNHP